jgi:hypothetical protein
MSLKALKVIPPPLSYRLSTKQFSMKEEIDINIAALKAYDAGDYREALRTFEVCILNSVGLTAL